MLMYRHSSNKDPPHMERIQLEIAKTQPITQCSFVSGAMAHQEAIEFPRLAIVMVLMVLSLLLL